MGDKVLLADFKQGPWWGFEKKSWALTTRSEMGS